LTGFTGVSVKTFKGFQDAPHLDIRNGDGQRKQKIYPLADNY
jgi:hypothetical protein